MSKLLKATHTHSWIISPKGEGRCDCGAAKAFPRDWDDVIEKRHLKRGRSNWMLAEKPKWNKEER